MTTTHTVCVPMTVTNTRAVDIDLMSRSGPVIRWCDVTAETTFGATVTFQIPPPSSVAPHERLSVGDAVTVDVSWTTAADQEPS